MATPAHTFLQDLEANGVAKIEGFLSPAEAISLKEAAKTSYASIAEQIDTGVADPDAARNFLDWHGIAFMHLPRLSLQTEICARVSQLIGRGWRFYPDRSFFRRHYDDQKHVPWHIDADAAVIGGMIRDSVNFWLPLNPVGHISPSLQFVIGSHKLMRREPLLTGDYRYRSDNWVARKAGWNIWTPIAMPGDAIVFWQHTLHRTEPRTQHEERESCELRFILPDALVKRIARHLHITRSI
jgi:ectoine hydroxylase-related dioxygenase (phytanoyl-CoA dioxygenase family)